MRHCKTCKKPFYVPPNEKTYFTRRRVGNASMCMPMRCEECRAKKKKRNRQLALPNFPIPNSRHGDGCFEGLTISALDDIKAWRAAPPPESFPPPEELTEKEKKKRRVQYVLRAPSWINDSVPPMAGATQYPWHCVATPKQVERPNVLKFSVEDRLTGVAWLRDLPEGLTLWWLEYAPWAANYRKAKFSLPFYAIVESIRQGRGGRILVRSTSQHMAFFESLGCRPAFGGKLLELSVEDAWRLVMSEYGVSGPVIELLLQQDLAGDADTAWIVEQIGRRSLTPQRVEAFTRLSRDVDWLDVKRLAVERGNIPLEEQTPLRHRVRDVMGALAVREVFEKLGAEVRYTRGTPALGQIVQFPKKIQVKGYRKLDPTLGKVTVYNKRLQAGEEIVVISRMWSKADYNSDKPEGVYELLGDASDLAPNRVLAVSREFDEVGGARQKSVIRSVTDRGYHLLVLSHTAKRLQSEVRELFRRLDPKIG
jgi:hypothetical protein